MPRISEEPLQKVTLNLVDGDKETLASFYPNLGWSVAARKIIKRYCDGLRREGEGIERRTVEISVPDLEPNL